MESREAQQQDTALADGVNMSSSTSVVGRFAPSPTGRMHAGNIYAALCAWLIAKSCGGSIVLRIEDLDRERSCQRYADQIMRDFEHLGLSWDKGPYYQHNRTEAYRAAYERLAANNIVYPCFCTRADLRAASAPHRGEKTVYPGYCRSLSKEDVHARLQDKAPAWRIMVPPRLLGLHDELQGYYEQNLVRDCGDFIIRRADGQFAYQLAVVVDDADQRITSVVRGVDLLCSTPQQMFLQDELGLAHPSYAHIPLLVASDGRRLSKRDKDASLESLQDRFGSAEGILGHIAGITGLAASTEPASAEELLQGFSLDDFCAHMRDPIQVQWC